MSFRPGYTAVPDKSAVRTRLQTARLRTLRHYRPPSGESVIRLRRSSLEPRGTTRTPGGGTFGAMPLPPGRPPAAVTDELPEYGSLRWGARKSVTGAHLVKLAPDVASSFPTGEAVNNALRGLMHSQEAA